MKYVDRQILVIKIVIQIKASIGVSCAAQKNISFFLPEPEMCFTKGYRDCVSFKGFHQIWSV